MQQQQPPTQIKIQLGEKEAEGIYANLAMIMHSPTEIVIDFARAMPRTPKARVLSRIIMTPMHAKIMAKALEDNLKKFEAQFGEIKLYQGADASSKTIGFESGDNYQPGDTK